MLREPRILYLFFAMWLMIQSYCRMQLHYRPVIHIFPALPCNPNQSSQPHLRHAPAFSGKNHLYAGRLQSPITASPCINASPPEKTTASNLPTRDFIQLNTSSGSYSPTPGDNKWGLEQYTQRIGHPRKNSTAANLPG